MQASILELARGQRCIHSSVTDTETSEWIDSKQLLGDSTKQVLKGKLGKDFFMGLWCFCMSCQQDTDCLGSRLFFKNVFTVNSLGR